MTKTISGWKPWSSLNPYRDNFDDFTLAVDDDDLTIREIVSIAALRGIRLNYYRILQAIESGILQDCYKDARNRWRCPRSEIAKWLGNQTPT